MTASNFAACLRLVRLSEGGNDDDPRDPGGRTSRGIIQREYNAYCQKHGLQGGDVWRAPDSVIDDIYHDGYWQPHCDSLAPGVDYEYFDVNVNCGEKRANITLQRALGIADDGAWGPATDAALAKANPAELIPAISAQRRAFYRSLPTFDHFGKGWLIRVANVEREAIKMIGAPIAVPVPKPAAPKPKVSGRHAIPTATAAASAGLAHWFGAHPGVVVAVFIAAFAVFAFIMSKQK